MKKWIKFILLVLFIYTIQAEEGLKQFRFDGRKDFKGGLNTAYKPNLLVSQSPDIRNFSTDDQLGLVKRDGFSYVAELPVSTSTKILNAYVLVKDDGSSYLLVHVGSAVYSASQIGGDWTLVKDGLSTVYPIRFATHYNKVFCSNGINTVFTWDGLTKNEYSFIPKGQYPLSADGRLWMGATVGDPSYVYFSEINVDPVNSDDWDITNNALEFGLGDGQVIKGLDYQRGIVWVYKDHSTYGIRSITNKYLANADYGTVSQFSINGYDNGKIFLDKTGFYYFAGGNVKYLSDDVNNILSGIGLIGANTVRINMTSDTDFSTGTFVNCYNNSGTVEISSISKVWTTNADFSPAYDNYPTEPIHSTQSIIIDDSVKISTQVGGGETKLDVFLKGAGSNTARFEEPSWKVRHGAGDLSEPWNVALNGWDSGWSFDGNDDSYVAYAAVSAGINGNVDFGLRDVGDTSSTPEAKQISKLRVKYQFGTYILTPPYQFETGGQDYNVFISRKETWGNDFLLNAYIQGLDVDGSNQFSYQGIITNQTDIANTQDILIDIKSDKNSTYVDTNGFGSPEVIRLVWQPSALIYAGWRAGLKIYEVQAWTTEESVMFSSAVYISPAYDTSQANVQYLYLYPSHNLGIGSSTGTITYQTRSATTEGGLATANWYDIGVASAINTSCDENQWFQWKAELWSSTITASPIIHDVELQYANTDYATYTSKMFTISNKITSWGGLVDDVEGTVSYDIRGATLPFADDTDTLVGTESVQWTPQESGADIILSTSLVYIQIKAKLESKDAKINGINITYSENQNEVGGLQEISSIPIDNIYHFACSTWTTYNDVVLLYNTNKVWEMWDNYFVSSFFKFSGNNYFASSTQPVICQMFSGNTDVDAVWKSPHTDFGIPSIDKKLRYAYITFEPYDDSFCHLEYGCDFSTFTKKVFVDLSGNSRNRRVELDDGYIGKNFYFTLSSTSTANVEIQHLDIFYQTPFKLRSEPE